MYGANAGEVGLNWFHDRPLMRLAALAALGSALALTGCGRKGPLDPPPSAAIAPPPSDQPSLGELNDPNTPGFRRAPRPPVVAAAPTTQAPPPPQRSFFLDFLIK
jgi:predicted small lipoprotein YifL